MIVPAGSRIRTVTPAPERRRKRSTPTKADVRRMAEAVRASGLPPFKAMEVKPDGTMRFSWDDRADVVGTDPFSEWEGRL